MNFVYIPAIFCIFYRIFLSSTTNARLAFPAVWPFVGYFPFHYRFLIIFSSFLFSAFSRFLFLFISSSFSLFRSRTCCSSNSILLLKTISPMYRFGSTIPACCSKARSTSRRTVRFL